MHDMPMTNTEDKPVKFKIKEGAYIERRFGQTFLCISDTKSYSFVLIDFQDHCPVKPDDFCGDLIQPDPKPLWELMPEIVKGRRFRSVHWSISDWAKLHMDGESYSLPESPNQWHKMPIDWMRAYYLLEPIE